MNFDQARRVADAVLYEGYLLYPYRASAVKNQFRWQFGVVAPRGYSENGGCEPWEMQTECVIEPSTDVSLDVWVRFLQVRARGEEEWEEGIEREVRLEAVPLPGEKSEPFVVEGAISGIVRVAAEPCGRFLKLRVRIENLTLWPEQAGMERAAALRHSLVGAHTLLGLRGGVFVSSMDPPDEAKEIVAACSNVHTWPVLAGAAGARDVMLSSPVVLYDYPAVAPESPGDLCDATEIDEILTLRVMTLTDEEKREARATDERARAIVDRSDSIPREVFERLHGAIRGMKPAAGFAEGDRVRIHPRRRSDSMDMFLEGRVALVKAVEQDLEGRTFVAVAVEEDLPDSYRRYFYYDPDELQLVARKEG